MPVVEPRWVPGLAGVSAKKSSDGSIIKGVSGGSMLWPVPFMGNWFSDGVDDCRVGVPRSDEKCGGGWKEERRVGGRSEMDPVGSRIGRRLKSEGLRIEAEGESLRDFWGKGDGRPCWSHFIFSSSMRVDRVDSQVSWR